MKTDIFPCEHQDKHKKEGHLAILKGQWEMRMKSCDKSKCDSGHVYVIHPSSDTLGRPQHQMTPHYYLCCGFAVPELSHSYLDAQVRGCYLSIRMLPQLQMFHPGLWNHSGIGRLHSPLEMRCKI